MKTNNLNKNLSSSASFALFKYKPSVHKQSVIATLLAPCFALGNSCRVGAKPTSEPIYSKVSNSNINLASLRVNSESRLFINKNLLKTRVLNLKEKSKNFIFLFYNYLCIKNKIRVECRSVSTRELQILLTGFDSLLTLFYFLFYFFIRKRRV